MPKTSHTQKTQEPFFQAFSWYAEKGYLPHQSLQTNAKDIGFGIATILELIEKDILNIEDEIQTTLNEVDRGILLRMAITSAALLAGQASDRIEYENDLAMREGKQ